MKVNIAHCLNLRNQLNNLISFKCDYYFCACSYFCCLSLTIVCQNLLHTHTNSYHITFSGAASRIRRVAHFSSLPVWLTNLITGQRCMCLSHSLQLIPVGPCRAHCLRRYWYASSRAPRDQGKPEGPKTLARSQFIWCINQQKLKCSHENQLKSRW